MDTREVATVCGQLGGETRIRLIELLWKRAMECGDPEGCDLSERCCDVGTLAEALGVSLPSTSYHLRELRHGGLVQTYRRGQHTYCGLRAERFAELAAYFRGISEGLKEKEKRSCH